MWNPKADCQLTSYLSDTLFLNISFEFLHTVLSSGLQSFMVYGPSWGQPVSVICLLSWVAVSSQMSQSGLNTSRKYLVILSGMDKTTNPRTWWGFSQPDSSLLQLSFTVLRLKLFFDVFCPLHVVAELLLMLFSDVTYMNWKRLVVFAFLSFKLGEGVSWCWVIIPHMRSKYQV